MGNPFQQQVSMMYIAKAMFQAWHTNSLSSLAYIKTSFQLPKPKYHIQTTKLKFKLHTQCTNSKWMIGNPNLIHNISTFTLSSIKTEDLSLGLKSTTAQKKMTQS